MRFVLAAAFVLAVHPAAAGQFSLRCDDGPHQPLIFTFDTDAQKAIYESPAQEQPLPGTILRSFGRSFLFSVQMIGPDFTDFVWDHAASRMEIGLRGTPFRRSFSCAEIPLRPVADQFESLWPKR
ncbi:MAG: hypothetical protein KF826_10740 [Xanthobacteraceae bacterium]|nr:hypothetical protein [Xanthobacteraceae bacterium]MBX3521999.1 hypothetical protein [Xanthobacteraceae bacterium]MBX3534817.1 hypothetical protein [Xanthobacteraceae bacterium]MBX3550333.1 hypothetical protein [Xanthobacteraceae bacterium]MCW5673745.1 hypothetical protein [Xanthobacteraceae bacterium]